MQRWEMNSLFQMANRKYVETKVQMHKILFVKYVDTDYLQDIRLLSRSLVMGILRIWNWNPYYTVQLWMESFIIMDLQIHNFKDLFVCMFGWLVRWLFGWMVGRTAIWFSGWLVGCLVGWFVVWFIVWLVGQLVDWFVGQLVCLLIGWSVSPSFSWSFGLLVGLVI